MAQRSVVGTLIDGLFSLKGRLGRGVFWMGSIALGVIAVVLTMGLNRTIWIANPEWPRFALFGIIQLVLAWPAFALTVKRGHDRERSALWTFGVNVAGQVVPFILLTNGRLEGAFWVWAVVGLYALVDYGLLPGTAGDNKYGPPPT